MRPHFVSNGKSADKKQGIASVIERLARLCSAHKRKYCRRPLQVLVVIQLLFVYDGQH